MITERPERFNSKKRGNTWKHETMLKKARA